MKIACPQCHTSYELTPAMLGTAGRSVRCARCNSIWFAEPPKQGARRPAAPITPPSGRVEAGAAEPPPQSLVEVPPETTPPFAPAEAAEGTPLAADRPIEQAAGAVEPVTPAPSPMNEPQAPASAAVAVPAGTSVAAAAAPSGQDVPAHVVPAETSLAADKQIEADNIETLAARRYKPRPRSSDRIRRSQSQRLTFAIIALAAINIALIGWRTQVVRLLPQTASLFAAIGLPVNLRQLGFKGITTAYEEHDGTTILVIKGNIVATGLREVEVPRLRFSIDTANGDEIYAWTALPTRSRLAPGESLPFQSRLASPPEQGRTIKVRFFNKLDVSSGLR